MPFKNGKSFTDLNVKIKKTFENIDNNVEAGLYELGGDLGLLADFYVPVDTNNLINSRAMKVSKNGESFTMSIGYYQDYAAALHSPKKGGKMDGWKPRPVPSPGKKTGGYNSDAKQGWLNAAWDEDGERLLNEFAKGLFK